MKKTFLPAIKAWAVTTWDNVDQWLCVYLPTTQRIWWCNLWDRKDEFHPCYRSDFAAILKMNQGEKELYSIRLAIRRQRIHDRNEPLTQ